MENNYQFDHNRNGFSYTYSANEQEELKKIREKYTGKEEDKMERVRRLDARVTEKAQMIALVLGIVGALILGLGLSLVISDLGAMLGMGQILSIVLGVAIGIIGCVPCIFAYPAYHYTLKREREKIAPEIIRLTDELMK
ncbi:MAG: DUF2207 domain-containing protein [Ruminococcaceae bacterium]|nr:DUF2207 domain-containing protein [Oscillospiraceae bacterium]